MPTTRRADGSAPPSPGNVPDGGPLPAGTLEQLRRVLESPPFRSSKRCSTFLRHVIERVGEGRQETLKERILGVEVFDRDTNYDTNLDPVVRSTAGEVRKRLAQYYCEPGREQEIRISLPAGSYVPEITPVAAPPEPAPAAAAAAEPPPPAPRTIWPLLAVAGVLLVLVAGAWLWGRGPRDELTRFWEPILDVPGPVLVCIGQPRAYGFRYDRKNEIDNWFERSLSGQRPPAEGAPGIGIQDLIPNWNRYISLGDVQTMNLMAGRFAHAGKSIDLRGGRMVTLADLRGKPVVLIGAFNNEWTLKLTGELRFSFREDPTRLAEYVLDRLHPEQRAWEVRYSSAPTARDYAILTRVINPVTEQTIVVAAGIAGAATRTAGEFLTNPAYFREALAHAPADWPARNMQIVLSTEVIAGSPGPPKVIATHFW